MFLNNDLLFVAVASIFIAGGVVITYNFYNEIFPTTAIPGNNIAEQTSVIESTNLQYVETSAQTINIQIEVGVQASNTYVNTGVQTSARMWLESIRNWINEILSSPTSLRGPGYVDAGVQTNAISTWQTVKQWFLEVCSIRSSQLSSLGQNKVTKWRNNLDSVQSVDLPNSESPLTSMAFGSPNTGLDKLLDPNDSASNVSEVISESSLQIPSNSVYDINIYNQEFLYESLNNVSNHIDYSYVINGVTHAVLVTADKILTIDPNIVVNPFIC
jgi:hypothetical protein